jgi:DNA-directed RNA polymerase specialized sigma24 family protein
VEVDMSVQENEAATTTGLACAVCVAHLAEAEFELLPETDAEVVTEHLSQCPDCRLFKEQLDTTREIIAATRAAGPTADQADDVLEEAQSNLADGRNELSLARLYRVAAVLDVEDADELVQQTLLDAVSEGASFDSAELIRRLTRTAAGERGHLTESLNEADRGSPAYDPDSETAELFYPEFYDEGPDVGRFVDSPNDWGHVFRLAPEEEVEGIELYGVTDSAIDELPDVGMRLITLVDIEGVSLGDAASGLHVSKERAAQELNSGRIHVRGAIDNYLNPAKP